MTPGTVHVWQETIQIPTYGVGKAEKNPMFFEKRVYQGSSGVVYPNAVIEKILDQKQDEDYIGLYLENDYIKVLILPQLGGRIQMAYDKIRQRHFIYYNQVIKPALVGLTGPWISGGIEFNWPQHHRPSTFESVDYTLAEGPDGAKTVYINEVEKMFHTKAKVAFTLYPDKTYIEIHATLYNRSSLPQSFLWWANPAVKVGDHYQSVFPTDVNAVFDHGKRDVVDFPIARSTYYKVDYRPGTDISYYKNIPVPTSYMAVNSDYDFVGGYEHDTKAGLLHVADHHVSPGKKQWTWGHGDFGRAWDRNLTDEDGPYIELMTGMYTDNQPDFTWLMPSETKQFKQYFLPYHSLGLIKNASKDLLLSASYQAGALEVKVLGTSIQKALQLVVSYQGQQLLARPIDLDPVSAHEEKIALPTLQGRYEEAQLKISIKNKAGKTLLQFAPGEKAAKPRPEAARAALQPSQIRSIETLYLTGLHLEQYRHATYSPVPYYQEALRREPTDIRSNTALGKWYLRKGQFEKSLPYLETAIQALTQFNPNPYDGEAYYLQGLAQRYLAKTEKAYDAFFKATWNRGWQAAAYYEVAAIDLQSADYDKAAQHAEQALDSNLHHSKARALLVMALRRQGLLADSQALAQLGLESDPFHLGLHFEKLLYYQGLADKPQADSALETLKQLSRMDSHNYMEYALEYIWAGDYEAAIRFLQIIVADSQQPKKPIHPMIYYYLGYSYGQRSPIKDEQLSEQYLKKAASADSYLCFPNRLQDILILRYALEKHPQDGMAAYYLGNLYYDKRQYQSAIAYWEQAAQHAPQFATVQRNLGLAYYNKTGAQEKALSSFEKAFALDPTDSRVFMELDQLKKKLNHPISERCSMLEKHMELTISRDDTYLEYVQLLQLNGDFEKAKELLMQRNFHPWEGGEGKASGAYVLGQKELAKIQIEKGDYQAAIQLLEAARSYPFNLGEGKLPGTLENDIFYYLGHCYEKLSDEQQASYYYSAATKGDIPLSSAIYYNDQEPDQLFYQVLAYRKIGQPEKAQQLLEQLLSYATTHENDQPSIDYFAVSLPNLLIFDEDLTQRNKINCVYLKGLAYLGLHRVAEAALSFNEVRVMDNSHIGAKIHEALIQRPDLM